MGVLILGTFLKETLPVLVLLDTTTVSEELGFFGVSLIVGRERRVRRVVSSEDFFSISSSEGGYVPGNGDLRDFCKILGNAKLSRLKGGDTSPTFANAKAEALALRHETIKPCIDVLLVVIAHFRPLRDWVLTFSRQIFGLHRPLIGVRGPLRILRNDSDLGIVFLSFWRRFAGHIIAEKLVSFDVRLSLEGR